MNKKLIFAFIGILLMITLVSGCGEDRAEEQVASTTHSTEVTSATKETSTEKANEETTKRSLLDIISNLYGNRTIKSENEIADETFEIIISAIKSKDKGLLKSVFSENAQNEADNLDAKAEELLSMIKGDIVSYTSASESGISTSKDTSYGDIRKVITSSFIPETQKDKYHIAISHCIIDDFDERNIGVKSLYIIKDKHWSEDYGFRGLMREKEDKPGIIIADE